VFAVGAQGRVVKTEFLVIAMLDTTDALRAHSRCRNRLTDLLSRQAFHSPYFCELAPDPDCQLSRFIRENDGDPSLEPELNMVRIAHATMHCVAIGLAQKRVAGETLDIQNELRPSGNLGAASASLVSAIWKLEKKLRSLAA
jgi:hypothetical protein